MDAMVDTIIALIVALSASLVACGVLASDRRTLSRDLSRQLEMNESIRQQMTGIGEMAARDAAELEKERRENVRLQNAIIDMRPEGCPDHDRRR